MAASSKQEFALVRWLVDESVGVMPVTAVKKGLEAYVGVVVAMRFHKKLYDAEILKISGKLFILSIACPPPPPPPWGEGGDS